jgi:hypothetical protein
MSDRYIIEVSSQPAGIVVRCTGGYRFFAASPRFGRLEGQLFRNAREAERAAIRLANGEPIAGKAGPDEAAQSEATDSWAHDSRGLRLAS